MRSAKTLVSLALFISLTCLLPGTALAEGVKVLSAGATSAAVNEIIVDKPAEGDDADGSLISRPANIVEGHGDAVNNPIANNEGQATGTNADVSVSDRDVDKLSTSDPVDSKQKTVAAEAPEQVAPVAEPALASEPVSVAEPAAAAAPAIEAINGMAHVQNVGDSKGKAAAPGKVFTVGTTGRALRMEAISLSLSGVSKEAGEGWLIRYRTHVQNVGWQNWASDGALAGTRARSLRIEALAVELNPRLAEHYDVWYRTHVQNVGWMAWTKNGQLSGSEGKALRLESIQVCIKPKGSDAPAATDQKSALAFTKDTGDGDVNYRAHVENVGWQGYVSDGKTAGTTGRALQVEAFTMNSPLADLEYRAHVENVGWQGWVSSGVNAGTTGRSLQVEALSVRVKGEDAERYDVWYRAHVAGVGWLDWACNGDISGSTGMGLPVESIQVKLVSKGGPAPGETELPAITIPEITAQAYVMGRGWKNDAGSSVSVGTTGNSLAIEGFCLSVSSAVSGSLSYRAHIANIGWENAVFDGDIAGGKDTGRAVEAVSIKLTGRLAEFFDIYYRAHSANYGWLSWAKNGASAGTSSCGYQMEALQIKLVPKGSAAPGSTDLPYTTVPIDSAHSKMDNRINSLASSTNWLLAVDTANCFVGIYRGSQGNWSNFAYWQCAPGKASTPTVKGLYKVTGKGYSFGHGYTCYYYTQFYGDYLFHSIKYNQGTFDVQDGTMGKPVSEGCVRMILEQAKWIYDNIPYGTTVMIY